MMATARHDDENMANEILADGIPKWDTPLRLCR